MESFLLDPTFLLQTSSNHAVWAAFLSAVAALSSATAAIMTYFIHRDNRIDLVRAEIVLFQWNLETVDSQNFVTIDSVANEGKGPALSFGLVANKRQTAEKITYKGFSRLRDVRGGGDEREPLGLRIPLDDCLIEKNGERFYRLTVRLFWTDLHEKKHLVNLLVQINTEFNASEEALAARYRELHYMKNENPQIIMLKRRAFWFGSQKGLQTALDQPPSFDRTNYLRKSINFVKQLANII